MGSIKIKKAGCTFGRGHNSNHINMRIRLNALKLPISLSFMP